MNIPLHAIPHGLPGLTPSLPKWTSKITSAPSRVKSQIAEVLNEPKMQTHVYKLFVPWIVGMSWASLIKQGVCDFSQRNELSF